MCPSKQKYVNRICKQKYVNRNTDFLKVPPKRKSRKIEYISIDL